MDRTAVLRKLYEEERRVAIGWRGAAGEANPTAAIREVLRKESEGEDAHVELQFGMVDPHSQRVFMALCKRYGLKPYRLPRQRKSTFMLKGPEKFMTDIFGPLVQACTILVGDELTAWVTALMSDFNGDVDATSP